MRPVIQLMPKTIVVSIHVCQDAIQATPARCEQNVQDEKRKSQVSLEPHRHHMCFIECGVVTLCKGVRETAESPLCLQDIALRPWGVRTTEGSG